MSDDIPTFGGANELDAVAATSSFLIIIGCAVLLETIFESIHIQTHETPYYDMVSAIEKELMISGFLAFAFNTVAASIGLLGDHWLIAINFADTAMPLSAAIYGSIGLMLIVRSVKHAQLWRRAANIRLAQLLMNYYEQPNELLDRIHRFFFMSVEDEEVKFRILHNIFCEAYCIQRKAFAFDEYCQKVYEKYLLNLVTISPLSWLLLCAFIACNYIRMHMRMDVYNCSGVDEDDEHHICQIENSTTLFVISGFGLLIVTGITYVMTITYIWRLMATKGIVSKSDFATFLQLLESNDNFNPDAAKMNLDELTEVLVTAVHSQNCQEIDRVAKRHKRMREIRNLCLAFFMRRGFVQYGFKQWTGKSIETVYDINTGELIVRQAVVVKRIQTKDSGGSNSSGNFLISPVGSVSRSFKSVPLGAPMSPLGTPSISPKKVAPINTSASLLSNTTPSPPMSLRKSGTSSANSSFRRNLRENRSPQRQEIMKNALESMNGGTLDSELQKVFWLDSPNLYFKTVEALVIFISFYMGLWAANFGTVVTEIPHPYQWEILCLLPALLSIALFTALVKWAALLNAIVFLDRNAINDTIDQVSAAQNISEQLRMRLIEELSAVEEDGEGTTPEEKLEKLFLEMDEDDSKFLTREELQHFLEGLRISFSKRKWSLIFREIDRDYDNEITFPELLLFVFPDNSRAKQEEQTRDRKVGRLIAQRVNKEFTADAASQERLERLSSRNKRKPTKFSALLTNLKRGSSANLLAGMGMGNRGNSASSVKSTTDDDSDEDSPPPLLAGLKKRASSFMAGLDRSKSDRNVNSNSESAVSSIDEEEDKNDVQHFELVNQTDIEGYLKKYQFDEPDCNGTKMVGGEFLFSTKGKNLHSLPENDHMPPCEVEDF